MVTTLVTKDTNFLAKGFIVLPHTVITTFLQVLVYAWRARKSFWHYYIL